MGGPVSGQESRLEHGLRVRGDMEQNV